MFKINHKLTKCSVFEHANNQGGVTTPRQLAARGKKRPGGGSRYIQIKLRLI